MVLAGDLIVTDSAIPGILLGSDREGGAPLLLGRVYGVGMAVERMTGRPVEVANLQFVPAGLPQGFAALRRRGALPIQLHLVSFPRVHPPTQGKVQEGNPIITEVEIVQPSAMAKPIPLAQAWARNHRIAGQGIPAGAYVKSVDPAARKIEISQAVKGYSGLTSLYDAPLRQISVKAM